MQTKIKRALLSVTDKQGIVEFAKALAQREVEILSTGGTAKLLTENGVKVTEVSDYTKFPEMMEGRLKTLHPKIHGGILGRRGTDDEAMSKQGILPIDLVCVNLYPFSKVVEDPECPLEKAIENIDIGGPALLRAAAKNYTDVVVVVRSGDYDRVIEEMDQNGGSLDEESRLDLAVAAFEHTARYDCSIANYLGTKVPDYGINEDENVEDDLYFPRTLNMNFIKLQSMRYGENPHQKGAFYRDVEHLVSGVATSRQIQGKALSYNNIADTDAAIECVRQFDESCCVIIKHSNPCGVALNEDLCEAYLNAFKADKESAYGGVIAFNRKLDGKTAKAIVDNQFCEVIVAPEVSQEAIEAVAAKKNVRLLECGSLIGNYERFDFRRVNGGLLVQDTDIDSMNSDHLRVVTKRRPDEKEIEQLLFAWKVCMFAKSNAIVYVKDFTTIGIGCGQTSRVFSSRTGIMRAQDNGFDVKGSALASDAYFPFRDGVDAAAKAGVTSIIQPGGSIRDEEVIDAADENNIAMVFTHMRHFRH